MYKLKIINSTVRPGRKGPQVAAWIKEIAEKNENFDTVLLDLALIDLPLMDEPNHPRLRQYQHEHTKKWSAAIDEADAFIFVTAEYNHNYPAPLRNALEYLQIEWSYKPAGIVSYGGVSAGTRAANSLKSNLTTLGMVPIGDSVNFPLFKKNNFDEQGNFIANEISYKAAGTMLKELLRWTKALKYMRENP